MEKICPIMSKPKIVDRGSFSDGVLCCREKCALWVTGYQTEIPAPTWKQGTSEKPNPEYMIVGGHCGLIKG